MNNNIEFKGLLDKFFNRKLTTEEQSEFESILSSNQEAAEEFSKANKIHETLGAIELGQPEFDLSKVIVLKCKKENRKRTLYRIAASLVIPLVVGLSVYLTSNYYVSQMEASLNEIICEAGDQAKIKLPDGSEVILQAKSKLIYPSKFTHKQRNVILEGEAVFKVESDKDNPFYVNNHDHSSRVMAYGTEFRVINYEQEENLYVFLKHGKVDFISDKLKSEVQLSPGNELVFSKNDQTVKIQEAADKYLALDQGVYNYRLTPLHDLVTELNRRFNKQIKIENTDLLNIKFTGTLKNESLSEIISMITQSSPSVKHKDKHDKIILY